MGFKSFADRISLNFEKSEITGIVGPNGSGKSNVIDAVRWVMGEQNAKMLRGEVATDIIFSGSEKRKALGMAEVTLVFDNKEMGSYCPEEYRYEEEIALTRRLYLDGQREFLINKRACRLKDIVSFFVASGIGGRSYSMIQQGQVDRILQAKPEQLREIVEEAAGIVIFKRKHDETKKKLENTQQNIDRLGDISKEVETRLDALEEQASKARKWKEYTEKLVEREKHYVEQSYILHNEKKKSLLIEKEGIDFERIRLATEEEKCQQELENFQKQLAETDPELSLINEEITKVREGLAISETRLIAADSTMEGASKRKLSLDADITSETKSLEVFTAESSVLEDEYKKAKAVTENAEEFLENFKGQIEGYLEQELVVENKLDDLKQEMLEVERDLTAASLRFDAIKSQALDYQEEEKSFNTKLMGFENEHSQVLILVDSAFVKLKNKENELSARKAQQTQLEDKITKNKEDQERAYSNLETCKHKYIETSTRYNYYKDLKHWTEDVKEWLPEKAFMLSSALAICGTERVLEGDILKAFGKWSERIVIEDESALEQIEEQVKVSRAGPVPITYLGREFSLSEEDKTWLEERNLKPLSSRLDLEKTNKALFSLLSRIYLSEEISLSEETLRGKPSEIIIFTQGAYVYTNAYDFNLGVGSEETALSIENQKVELKEKTKKALERVEEETKKHKKIKEEEEKLTREYRLLVEEHHTVKQEHLGFLGDLQGLKQKANAKQEQIQQIRMEQKAFFEKNAATRTEKIALEANLRKLESQRKEYEQEEEDLKELREDARDRNEEVKRQLEAFRFDKISAETKLQTFEISYKRNEEQKCRYKERLSKLIGELAEVEKAEKESWAEKQELEEKLIVLADQKAKLENLLSNKRSENSALTEGIRKFEKEIRQLRSESDKLQNKIQEKRSAMEKLDMLLEGVLEMALERCHIKNLSELVLQKDEEFQIQNVYKQITSLKTKIEGIGPINMMAVEEYDELVKRRDFINAQKEEVYAAINLLQLAIEEITKISEEKFLAAYNTLNNEFKELFPILFPRGKGELVLTDTKKPLEAGVEIMVRLPGKNMQNMRLFSGGEKALTAIALIFALLKSKPTPFCFLDEVDAALDEANVGHYNRLLESLSDKFQFIVITHRRGTMEVLDTLYGVTMQEPGVSKVVGVDLSKSLPAHLQKAFKEKENTPKIEGSIKKPEYML